MKKLFVLILFIVIVSSFVYAVGYTDLSENHWAYNSVMDMTDKGIFAGYPDGSFRPGNKVTREEFSANYLKPYTLNSK